MFLNAERTVEKSLVKTTITIESFGGDNMTDAQERACLKDWSITLSYADIIFSKYVKMNDETHVVELVSQEEIDEAAQDESHEIDGDLITISVADETVDVDEDLCIEFTVDARTLKSRVGMYKCLKDEIDIAKAMILVFEATIAEKINEALEINRHHLDNFETNKIYVV